MVKSFIVIFFIDAERAFNKISGEKMDKRHEQTVHVNGYRNGFQTYVKMFFTFTHNKRNAN